ncbi:MAG: phosphatidate cytidylyltransferase [Pelagibacteraceae bacterium]
MSIEIKKRILTSIPLILILLSIFFSNIALLFFLIIISVISFLEFTNLILKIYKKKIIYAFIFNFIFALYIFSFSSCFFIFSQFTSLKNLIFLALLICIFSDIGGLIFGKFFKGPKLTRISPNKTISGSLGSFLFAFLITYMISNFSGSIFSFYVPLILSFFVSFTCQCGDLFFSYIKRKANVKNTGNFLPGHGGFLDRIDGILFGIPFGILFSSIILGLLK